MMITDEILGKTIGANETDLARLCDVGGANAIGCPAQIDSINCLPSVVDSYVEESQMWMQAVTKIRYIIGYFMPVLMKKEESKTGEIGAKDAFDVSE